MCVLIACVAYVDGEDIRWRRLSQEKRKIHSHMWEERLWEEERRIKHLQSNWLFLPASSSCCCIFFSSFLYFYLSFRCSWTIISQVLLFSRWRWGHHSTGDQRYCCTFFSVSLVFIKSVYLSANEDEKCASSRRREWLVTDWQSDRVTERLSDDETHQLKTSKMKIILHAAS